MTVVIRISEEPETQTRNVDETPAEVNWDQEVEKLTQAIQADALAQPASEKTPEQTRANARESLVFALHKADQALQAFRYMTALQILETLEARGYQRSPHMLNEYLNDTVEMAQGLQTPVLTVTIGILMVTVGEDFCASAEVPAPVAELSDWLRRNAR